QDDLSHAVPSAVYGVAREALSNVVKRAGAIAARLSLSTQEPSGRRLLHLEANDDGTGGADTEGGGLQGLGRRVAALDGSGHVSSPPGGPTVITTEIPSE